MGTVTRIIRAVYGPSLTPVSTARPPGPLRRRRHVPWLARLKRYYEQSPRTVWLGLSVVTALTVIGLTIRYYNLLVGDHVDALAARSKVEALIQRRSDLALTLEQVIIAHARHEATIFGNVADKRVALGGGATSLGAAAAAPPAALTSLPAQLGRLLAIAEQYPQLRLSENFKLVTNALVEVERDLDRMRQQYVDATNRFAHHRDTFPGNFFSCVFGFKELPYFEADAAAKRFSPVKY